MSYARYRWENNIRAAAILGVVGAGGLGQMLMFHLSLFQMQRVATIVALVALVDGVSAWLRGRMRRRGATSTFSVGPGSPTRR